MTSTNDRPTLRERVREVGLVDVYEFMELSGESRQKLGRWFTEPKKQQTFECLLAGAVALRHQATYSPKLYWQYHLQLYKRRYADDRYDLFESKVIALAELCINEYPDSFGPDTIHDPGSLRHMLTLIEKK